MPKTALFNKIESTITNTVNPLIDPGQTKSKNRINTFDLWNNQFENEDREDAFPYAACFLQFADIDWEARANGVQYGQTLITLHIAFEKYRGNALQVLEALQTLDRCVHGLGDKDYFNELIREAERQPDDYDNLFVWEIDYSTLLTDTNASPHNKRTLMDPGPTIGLTGEIA